MSKYIDAGNQSYYYAYLYNIGFHNERRYKYGMKEKDEEFCDTGLN